MKAYITSLLLLVCLTLSGTTYYVRNGGNDAAAGTSDVAAWAYCPGMVGYTGSATLSAGDSILFKRGSVWRLQEIVPTNGTAGNYTYYGAYGAGNKPLLIGSSKANKTSDWVATGIANVWKRDSTYAVDVGNIVFNHYDDYGIKCMTDTPLPDSLDAQGEYWYSFSGDTVVLYSVLNPAIYYFDIEICPAISGIQRGGWQYCIFQNLDFRNFSHDGSYLLGDAHHIYYYDLDFFCIGGVDYLATNYTSRMGNGITAYCASYGCPHDVTIERCRIENVYDDGISPQGGSGAGQPYTCYNWTIRNNIIIDCHQSYNIFWGNELATVYNIWFENNTCINNDNGWSNRHPHQRPDPAFAARCVRVGILYSGDSITIKNNIFYGSRDYLVSMYDYSLPYLSFDNNCYYPRGSEYYGRVFYTDYCSSLADWQTATGQEPNAIANDPLFVSATNYHLQGGSPCIGAGISLGITSDFDKWQWKNPPSIGAYEYYPSSGFAIDKYGNFTKDKNGNFMKIQ